MGPVFDCDAFEVLEVAVVEGGDGEAMDFGGGGDQEIEFAAGLAGSKGFGF